MTDRLPIDEFDDELGREIAAVLEPYEADPDEFARAVRERVAMAASKPQVSMPAFLRRAAGLLPPVVVPLALTRGGIAATAVVAKKVGWKYLPAAFAFPAAVVAMLFVTFFYGLRRAVVRNAETEEARTAQHAITAWWQGKWKPALIVGIGIAVLAIEAPAEAALVVLGVSMLCLVGIVGALARTGFATRREVGGRCTYFLGLAALIGAQFGETIVRVSGVDRDSSFVAASMLALGALACTALGSFRTEAPRRKRGSRSGYGGIWFALCTLFFVWGDRYWGGQRETTRELAAQTVERWHGFDSESSPARWGELAGAVVHLRADGRGEPDCAGTRSRFLANLERRFARGEDVNILQVAPIEAIGWFRDADYERFRDDCFPDRQVLADSPIHFVQQAAFKIAVRDRLVGFSDTERARIADRALATIGDARKYGVLDDVGAVLDILDTLGRAERGDALGEFVHRALRATWTGRPGSRSACFAPGFEIVDRDENGVPVESRLSFVWLDSTELGVRLMDRFGVPDGIDLRALDVYLAETSRSWSEPRGDHVLAAAARSHLHALPEWGPEPPRTIFGTLVELRLVVGTSLMVVFCLLVTARAPRELAASRFHSSQSSST